MYNNQSLFLTHNCHLPQSSISTNDSFFFAGSLFFPKPSGSLRWEVLQSDLFSSTQGMKMNWKLEVIYSNVICGSLLLTSLYSCRLNNYRIYINVSQLECRLTLLKSHDKKKCKKKVHKYISIIYNRSKKI